MNADMTNFSLSTASTLDDCVESRPLLGDAKKTPPARCGLSSLWLLCLRELLLGIKISWCTFSFKLASFLGHSLLTRYRAARY